MPKSSCSLARNVVTKHKKNLNHGLTGKCHLMLVREVSPDPGRFVRVVSMKNSLKNIVGRWWWRLAVGNRNAPWRAGLGWDLDTCNTGWLALADKSWLGWIGLTNRTLLASKAVKPTSPCSAASSPCVINCARVIWDSLARRPLKMRWSPRSPKASCRACEPSGAFSNDMALWMPFGGCAARHRRRVGICRRWHRETRNWTPSMSSKTSRWRRGQGWTCLRTRALWGSVCGAWVSATLRARWLCERLETHWRQHGCPAYAQFDNDSRFQGTHTHPDVLGQVIRCCLSLGIAPVFAPAREHGPQNLNESFNHLWQQKVWPRFHHASPSAFQATRDRFVAAYQQRRVARDDQAPARRAFPKRWQLDLQRRPNGTIIYLRRTDSQGAIRVLGHRWGGWTRCGFTAWCEPRWTWMKIKSAAAGCVVALRTTNPWSKPSDMYFPKNIFIPPDQHQMTLARLSVVEKTQSKNPANDAVI